MRSRPRVLAAMDAYRVSGPARQLLAAAVSDRPSNALINLAVFQRSANPTPFMTAASQLNVPTFVVRDRFPGDPRTALALARLAARPGTDVLQTHGYKANVLACLVAGRVRRPWVAFLHGETSEDWKVRVYFALERRAVRRADRIVVVSHDMARKSVARGIPSSKIRVVHNACLVTPPAGEDVPAWRPDAPPVIGLIARLSSEKGVGIALRVHQLVTQRCREARLWVVGEGPDQAKLARAAERLGIASSVEWLGYYEDMNALYRRMTVILMPSRSEGLPNVGLEAMAFGIPVVASAVGGVPELVCDGRTGFLAPSGDVERLADRVLQLLEDDSLRRRLGQQGRLETTARFSLDGRLGSLAQLYAEMLA